MDRILDKLKHFIFRFSSGKYAGSEEQCNLSEEDVSDLEQVLQEKSKQLERLNADLRKRLSETESEIEGKCKQIEELQRQLQDKDNQKIEKEAIIKEICTQFAELKKFLREKDSKITETQIIIDERSKELELAKKQIQEKESIIEQRCQQLDELRKRLQDKDNTLSDTNLLLGETVKQLEDFQQQLKEKDSNKGKEETISKKVEDLQQQLKVKERMIAEKESLEKDKAALKKKLTEKDSNIKQLENANSNLQKQLQSAQDRLTAANSKITILTEEERLKLIKLQENDSTITEKNKVIEKLQRRIEEESAERAALITAKEKQIIDFQCQFETLQRRIEEESAERAALMTEKEEQIIDLQRQLEEMKISATKTHNVIEQYKKDVGKLKRDLTDKDKTIAENTHLLTRSRVVEVQILFKQPGEIIERLAKELGDFLKSKCSEYELRVIRCMKGSDIQPDIPLLLVFVSTHGYGQDVLTALKGSLVSKKTALVIVRLKLPHALPVHPSDRILTSKEIECLGGVYDIAFTQDKGIYTCTQNNENAVSILNFISRVADGKLQST